MSSFWQAGHRYRWQHQEPVVDSRCSPAQALWGNRTCSCFNVGVAKWSCDCSGCGQIIWHDTRVQLKCNNRINMLNWLRNATNDFKVMTFWVCPLPSCAEEVGMTCRCDLSQIWGWKCYENDVTHEWSCDCSGCGQIIWHDTRVQLKCNNRINMLNWLRNATNDFKVMTFWVCPLPSCAEEVGMTCRCDLSQIWGWKCYENDVTHVIRQEGWHWGMLMNHFPRQL